MKHKYALPTWMLVGSLVGSLAVGQQARAVDPATGIAAAGLAITIGNEIKNLAAKDATAQVVVKSRTDGPDGDDKALAGDSDADDWVWEYYLDADYFDARAEALQVKAHIAAGELHYAYTGGKGWRPNLGVGYTGKDDNDGWHGVAIAYPDSTPPGETAAATVGAFLWNGSVEFGGYKRIDGTVAEVVNSPNRGIQTILGMDFTRDAFTVAPGAAGFTEVSLTSAAAGGFGNQKVDLYHTSIGFDGSDYSLGNVAPASPLVAGLASASGIGATLAAEIASEADTAFAGMNGSSPGDGDYMTVGAGALDFTTMSFADGLGSSDEDFIELFLQNVALVAGSAASDGYTGPSEFARQVLRPGESFDASSFAASLELMEIVPFIPDGDENGAEFALRIVTNPENIVDALNRQLTYHPDSPFATFFGNVPVGAEGVNQFSLALNYSSGSSYFAAAGANSRIGQPVPEPMTMILLAVGFFGLRLVGRGKVSGLVRGTAHS